MKLWLRAGTLLFPLGVLAIPPSVAVSQSDRAEEFDGRIEPSRSVLVAAPKDGILAAVHVDVGDVVTVGQELARLNSQSDELYLALAEQRLASTADDARARATMAEVDARIARREPLIDDELIPEVEREELRQRRVQAEIDVQAAAEARRLNELERDRARYEVERDRLCAPISGVVVERLLSGGEGVERSRSGIVRLSALDPLRIEVALPLRLLHRLHVGDPAWVRTELDSKESREARVLSIARSVDTASATFLVRLELDNRDLALPEGLRCQVRFSP